VPSEKTNLKEKMPQSGIIIIGRKRAYGPEKKEKQPLSNKREVNKPSELTVGKMKAKKVRLNLRGQDGRGGVMNPNRRETLCSEARGGKTKNVVGQGEKGPREREKAECSSG